MIQSKFNAKMTAAAVGVGAFIASVAPIFAADDPTTLTEMLKAAINTIGNLITTVFNPIALIGLAICLVLLVMGKNSKSAETAMSWGKRIIIVFIIFNSLSTIMKWVAGLAGDGIKKDKWSNGIE